MMGCCLTRCCCWGTVWVRDRTKLVIRPGFLVLLTAAFLLDHDGIFALCFAAAVLHELGHLAAVYACGGRVQTITLGADGGCIRHGRLTNAGERITALAGPAVNLAVTLACAVLPAAWATERLVLFTGANLALGLYNLLPVRPLDGGRFWESLGSERLLSRLEPVVCGGFLIFGLYISLKTRYNGTVLCAGLALAARVLLRYFTKERMIQWKT